MKNVRSRRLTTAAAFCALAALLAWAWESRLEDLLITKRWGVVQPGVLYRSGYLAPVFAKSILEKHGIRAIIDLAEIDPDHPSQRAELAAAKDLGIARHKLPLIGDGTGDAGYYVAAVTLIHRAVQSRTPTLIHCAAGTQRTGGAVALYRLLVLNTNPADVLAEMQRYDWRPERDRVLVEYLDANMRRIAEGLVENGVLESAPDPLPVLAADHPPSQARHTDSSHDSD